MSYESVLEELKAAGIVPEKEEIKDDNNSRELELISNMEKITGVGYSDEQKRILLNHDNSCIIACAGSGKALANGTKVLTKYGYKNIEDLNLYEVVYSNDGEEELVLGVFPQGKKKVYRVKFNNGHIIECCGEHLWTIKRSILREEQDKTIFSTYDTVVNTLDIKKLLEEESEVNLPTLYIEDPAYLSDDTYKSYDSCFGTDIDTLVNIWKQETNSEEQYVYEKYKHLDLSIIELMGVLYNGKKEYWIKSKELLDAFVLAKGLCGVHCKVIESLGYYLVELCNLGESSIVEITETEEYKDMTCIKVSGKTELFITEHCYVTHNTTILTNLIAKRIMTGEIKNSNKVVCTTYSKGGATEMEDRLHKLLQTFGMDRPIKVVTMHAFFYSIIRKTGLNLDVISENERNKFIRESAKDANLELRDDDLMNLSNLLSFQVNNLMSDARVIQSEANTFEDMSLEQYANVRKGYAIRKAKAGLLDFDDMQMYLYKWLVKDKTSENEYEKQASDNLRAYCHGMWDDFYIDEAQDISKIQFAILREMVQDTNNKNKLIKNLTFVGDDDQCLVEGTIVRTLTGYKRIEEIQVGDKVLSASGRGSTIYAEVKHISKTKVNKEIVKITTSRGKEIKATDEHVGFYIPKSNKLVKELNQASCMFRLFGGPLGSNDVYESSYRFLLNGVLTHKRGQLYNLEPSYDKDIKLIDRRKQDLVKKARLSYENDAFFVYFKDLKVGDKIAVWHKGRIEFERIKRVKRETYDGLVFDLDVPLTRNFMANHIIVHNCIYKWRGADPSIILNVGNIFDMKLLMLSTNYRCKNNIVDFAAESVKHNSARYSKSMKAHNQGGKVQIAVSDKTDLCALSEIATKHIKKLLDKGERLEDICVMSRNNFHLAILSNMLLRNGIYTTSNYDMKLTNSSMYKDIRLILNLGEDCYDISITRTLLWKLCRYLSVANAGAIANFQDSIMLNLTDTLGYILKHIDRDKTVKFDKEIKHVPREAEETMKYRWSKFSYDTIVSIRQLYNYLCEPDITKRICGVCDMYLNSAGALLYKRADKSRSIKGLCNYVYLLLRDYGYQNTMEFLRITEQYEQGVMDVPGSKLTLTTIHSAKGKEWKNVIAFAVDNITMPGKEDIEAMIKDGQSLHDINEYIDEERRLYYVEMTRAKENLLIITYRETSIFLMESIQGINKNNQDTNSMLIDSLSQDSYVSDTQYKNLFNFNVVQSKILDEDGEFHYNLT